MIYTNIFTVSWKHEKRCNFEKESIKIERFLELSLWILLLLLHLFSKFSYSIALFFPFLAHCDMYFCVIEFVSKQKIVKVISIHCIIKIGQCQKDPWHAPAQILCPKYFFMYFCSRYILNYFFSWEIFCISLVDAYIIMLWWYHNFFHASSLAFQGRKKYTKVHTSGLWKNWLPVSCCTSGFV